MDDYTILASDDNFGTVTICPGGVVHINLAHLSLKFVESDFVRFSELINRARVTFGSRSQQTGGKPRLQIVSQERSDDEPSDPVK